MKKKIAAVLLLSTLIAGTVSASSINGDYKGNPIVKVRSNGTLLDPIVPAQIIDGVTMLPLRDVSTALGAAVKWDQNTYSVDLNAKSNVSSAIDVSQIANDLKQFGVTYVQVASNGSDFNGLTIMLNTKMGDASNDLLKNLFMASANTTSTFTTISFIDHQLGILSDDLRKHFNGKLTVDELSSRYFIDNQPVSQQNNSSPSTNGSSTGEKITTKELHLYSNDGKHI